LPQNSDGYDLGGLSDDRLVAAGLLEQPIIELTPPAPVVPISMHTPACTPVIQNRRRIEPTFAAPAPAGVGEASLPAPSLTSLPAHLVANAHRQTSQDMNELHKKLATLYSPEQFEPTPINPNHQLSMQETSRLESSDLGRSPPRHERSDSLELDKVFADKSPKPPNGNMDDLSNQLSNMSFSVGDIAAIQDEGNLSNLFDDSIKAKEKSPSSGESGTKRSDKSNKMPFQISSLGTSDMSVSTFGGDSMGNIQSMNMSTQSFTHVFEESIDKV